MRPARSKTSSSVSNEADEGKFYDEHNSSPSPSGGTPAQREVSKTPQGSSQAKRQRDENNENLKATPSKKPKKASEIDLEELLAQTYPKQGSYTPSSRETVRRSSRSKYRQVKPVDSWKKWSGIEEICVARALLETSSPSGELNMNMFYQRTKEELQRKISNSQLYDKARSMNRRFRSIQSKLQEQNIPEEGFAFRTLHEPALFQLWKQIWGKNNNISANGGQIARDGNLSEAENPRETKSQNKIEESDDERAAVEESTGDQRQHEEQEAQQRNLQEKLTPQTLAENGNNTTHCEGKGLENRMKNLLESTEQRIEASIQSSYNRLQASLGGGCTCSILSRRMKELMDAVNSVEEFPGFSAAQANELQQKWRRHKIQELKMFSECFGLLHAQCKAFLENLEN